MAERPNLREKRLMQKRKEAFQRLDGVDAMTLVMSMPVGRVAALAETSETYAKQYLASKGSVVTEHQNLWGKFPWQQLWCMYAEKMAELDLYFAEDARRVIERIDADHVGIGASCKGFGLLADMEIEFSQRSIHWFMLDVHPAQEAIRIRYLLRNKLIRVKHVYTLASRWFADTHYGTTNAVIRPSDPATSGRLLAEALLNDEERESFWNKVYEKRKDWTEH